MGSPLPPWAVDACIASMLFTLMFGVGLAVPAGELRLIWRRPLPMLRGPFAVLVAILVTAVATVAAGHLIGGPEPSMRTAVAISSAARNAGLALLVATRNEAPPAVIANILAYVVISALTIVPDVFWRRRTGARAAAPALCERKG